MSEDGYYASRRGNPMFRTKDGLCLTANLFSRSEITTEDLVRYAEGASDAEGGWDPDWMWLRGVEEAICKSPDLFKEYLDIRRRIWRVDPQGSKGSESVPSQTELLFYEPKTAPVHVFGTSFDITTEDLIKFVEGSLGDDMNRYRQIENAILEDADLYEQMLDLRRSIWGTGNV